MESGDENAIDSSNNCENTRKIEHMQSEEAEHAIESSVNAPSTEEKATNTKEDDIHYEKVDNAVVSSLHTNPTEENISETEKTEEDVAKTEEVCDIIRNENMQRIDGEQETVLQTTSTESTISIQKSVLEIEYNRVPQAKERIKHTMKFTTEEVQTTSEVIPIKRGQPQKKVTFKIKVDVHGVKAAPILDNDQRNESEKLKVTTENKESEKLEDNTKEHEKEEMPLKNKKETENAEAEPTKSEEKKEEKTEADELRLPTVTTHSNELEASSSGTKTITEEKEDEELEMEQEEDLVETENDETDDEEVGDEEKNDNSDREIPRTATGWENVKKPTGCPMEKKDSREEDDNADDDEKQNTDDDENQNAETDEEENDENKSTNLKSTSRQEVNEEDENINNDEIVASPPRRMKRKSVAPKTKVQSVTIEKQDEDPVEKDDEETDDDILIRQFRVARTQPPRKRTKGEKNATTKKEEKKDEKDVEKRGKGVVQKKAAKALGTRTPTRRSLRVQESEKAVEEEEEEREIVKETKRKVGRKPRKTVKKEESDIDEEDEEDDENYEAEEEEVEEEEAEKEKKPFNKRKRQQLQVDKDTKSIVPKQKKKVVLYQKIPPAQLIELIKIMPDEHKEAVRKIGFGGFLSLSMANHNSALADYIVSSSNVDRQSIVLPGSGEIFVTPEDVHQVYGVPLGGEEIVEPENEDIDDNYVEFLATWRKSFKLKKGSPTNLPLISRIKDLMLEPVSNEFIWNFVIAAVNSCMRSTNNPQVYIRFMYSCMNTNTIANLDWSTFVYRHWKKSVLFFDRLQREGQQVPRQIPLLTVWNRERMTNRISIEKARGFGQGIVLNRIGAEPTVQENAMPEAEIPKKTEATNMAGSSSNAKSEMMEFLENFGTLAKTLASNVNEMYNMLDKANEMFNEADTTDKMHSLVENIWNKYTSKKQKLSQNKDEEEPKNKTPSLLSQDQHLFDEPGFMEELDKLMANAWNMYYEQKANKNKNQRTPTEAQIHETVDHPEYFNTPRLDIPTPQFRLKTPSPEPEIPSNSEIRKPANKSASNETPETTRIEIAKYTSFNLLSPSPTKKGEQPENAVDEPTSENLMKMADAAAEENEKAMNSGDAKQKGKEQIQG
ncbi:uncharacterized protein [Spinacia oleracea]|uniref:Aminotransferase-like plant mobile domain-containing protein n=1 Tax=Spinacia oleracea TaxID=3562 RepID=A0ABM3R088_SPIOL|nr:uncharacterized protein LOC110781191 [Spinacia oleracea]